MKKVLSILLAFAGCTHQPPAPAQPLTAYISAMSHNICFGADVAYVVISTQGGRPPYEYRMDYGPYQCDSVIRHIPSGGHYFTVKDRHQDTVHLLQIIVGVSAPNCLP